MYPNRNKEKILPSLVLGHVLLEVVEGFFSGTELVNLDGGLVVADFENHVSVGSLHSEVVELGDALVVELNTSGHGDHID